MPHSSDRVEDMPCEYPWRCPSPRKSVCEGAELNSLSDPEVQLAQLHFKNEASFPFEKYITRLYECFEALEDNEQGYRDAQKDNKMLENVTLSTVVVIALKTLIGNSYPNDFAQASTHMAAQIALFLLATQGKIRNKRCIGAMDSRGGGRGGRGRGRYTTLLSGVDVSDPSRSFSPNEWRKLVEGHPVAQIHEMRGRGCGRGRGGRGRNRDGGRGRSSRGGRQGRNISASSVIGFTDEQGGDSGAAGTGSGGRGSERRGRSGASISGNRYTQQRN